MFNPFKQTVVAEKPKVYSDVIEQIHHEFETAGDNLLIESLNILTQCEAHDKEKGNLLKKIGFTGTREARLVTEIEQKESDAKLMAQLVQTYKMNYPNNKFITEEMVGKICQKYGLVCGDVNLYKGFVPKEKLEMIARFELKKVTLSIKQKYITEGRGLRLPKEIY